MKKALLMFCAAGLVFVAACATGGRPDWVLKGSGAFKGDKKSLYGVGIAEGIKSEAMRRMTADNRAVAEVSKQLSVMSTSLMRDYMGSTTALEQEKTSGEQFVENTVKTFASNTITGVKITDRWDNGSIAYSLAVLNIDDLKSMTNEVKQLSQQAKEYIKANAEKALDKLEAEQSKLSK
jgi:glutamate synthase domain-containing protein 1